MVVIVWLIDTIQFQEVWLHWDVKVNIMQSMLTICHSSTIKNRCSRAFSRIE